MYANTHSQAIANTSTTNLGAVSRNRHPPIGRRRIHTHAQLYKQETKKKWLFEHLGANFLVGGDWNAKHRLWGIVRHCARGAVLGNLLLNTNRLNVLTTAEPTHFPVNGNRASVIDFGVYAGISGNRFSISRRTELHSDHLPLLVEVKLAINGHFSLQNEIQARSRRPRASRRLLTNKSNLSVFIQQLESSINLNVEINSPNDIDDMLDNFMKKLYSAAKASNSPAALASMPPRQNIVNNDDDALHPPQPPSTFIRTAEQLELVRLKRRLRKRWMRSRQRDDWPDWQRVVRRLASQLRRQRQDYVDFVLRNADPLKQGDFNLWHATKKLKRQPHAQHSVRNPNGQWCQSENDRIEAFADELKDRFTPFDFAPSEHRHRVECFLKQTVITNGINSSATRMRHVTLSELDAYI
ncbi:hypothetical protein ACLKA6_008537 [Drosophila palustris]